MRNEYADRLEDHTTPSPPPTALGRRALLLGTPVLLGALFSIHPDGSGGLDGLLPIGDAWLYHHVAMLPLLGLLGASFYALLGGYARTIATIVRIGVAVYLTFYVAFEAIAGVATGLLVDEAHAVPADQQAGIAAAIDALDVPSVVIGFIGTFGAVVAIVAAGVLLRRSGAPLVPVCLLGGTPVATMFHGGSPVDAFAMSLFLVGVAWLELKWRPADEPHATEAT